MKRTTDQLESVFKRYANSPGFLGELALRGYACAEHKSADVLFVGMNPSYPAGEVPGSFTFDPVQAVTGYSRFYKPFQDLAIQSGKDSWTYIDTLYFRETKQAKLWPLLGTNDGLNFILEQLKVTMSILEKTKPKMIVVCNSGARRFFGVDKKEIEKENHNIWMGYNFEFDEKLGADVITGVHSESVGDIKRTTLVGTPVLFTGTLTYMPKSDKNRLSWHMRHILKSRF